MDTRLLPAFVGPEAPTEDRMHWVRVPFQVVRELYEQTVLRVQRNHARRARNARHLVATDHALHVNYLASRTADGKVQLIDGYTRLTTIEQGEKQAPAHVWLGVVDCEKPVDADHLYDAVDSRAAVKRGRDAFEEGLRRSGLLGALQSPAFAQGQAVSAVQLAAGERDVRKAVYALRKSIALLDPLHIRAGRAGLPAGALAALLAIAANEPERARDIQEFAAALQNPEAVPKEREDDLEQALSCARALDAQRQANALSGKNVPAIMELVLQYWREHPASSPGPAHAPLRSARRKAL